MNPRLLFRNTLLFLWSLGIITSLQACSVYMAATGEPEPDLGSIQKGANRGAVELQLGAPIASTTLDDGRRQDIYEYQIGNEPSTGRAIAHGAADLVTLGLWELLGTPIEGVAGDKYRMTITYDQEDNVDEIRSRKMN